MKLAGYFNLSLLCLSLCASLMLSLPSCDLSEKQRAGRKFAYGKADDIYIVADEALWQGPVGDTLRMHFAKYYPLMPQPEPTFSIRFIPADKMSSTLYEHRTVIFVADLKAESEGTRLFKQSLGEENTKRIEAAPEQGSAKLMNKYAGGQLVVYLFGNGPEALAQNISKKAPELMTEISERDKEKIKTVLYVGGNNKISVDTLKTKLKVLMNIPKSYTNSTVYASNTVSFVRETKTSVSYITVQSLPLPANGVIDEKLIFASRDSMTKKYYGTYADSSYMCIDDRYLKPEYRRLKINGYDVLECRGVFRMVNDFKGGPFMTYLFEDKKNKRMIMLDGFVHAPSGSSREMRDKKPEQWYKRPFVRQMEVIFDSVKLM
jgi:hypothetical protein